LDQVFRLENKRTVSNDWVVRYDNRLLQLERQSGRPPARSTVLVYEAIDGQLEIRYRDRVMRWTELQAQPSAEHVKPTVGPVRPDRPRVIRLKPKRVCDDHPWRRSVEQFRIDQQLAGDRRAYRAVNP
jgi:hypothetical protein